MKKLIMVFISVWFIFSFLVMSGSISLAQETAAREGFIRSAYKEILTAADKNRDGKLSKDECMAISKDKKKIEKDCKYWDADGNGVITEDEYVKQAVKIMR